MNRETGDEFIEMFVTWLCHRSWHTKKP